jgi:hypothetical protein
MRSVVMRCLAAGVLSMCLLATAHAQQVPLESRPKLRELQEREQALLNARRVLTELLNDRTSLVLLVPVRVNGREEFFPAAVSRATVSEMAILAELDKEKYTLSAEGLMRNLLAQDRDLRQHIQRDRIPEIDKRLAETRSEVGRLTAQAGPQGAHAQPTAEFGPATRNVPMKDGHRVDVCLVWSGQCGKPAADRWCVDRGFGQSLRFSIETIDLKTESSVTLGSHDVCSATHHPPSGCGAFKSITCAGK